MKVGIVGFPGAGKTTIFNALTGLEAATGDFGGGKVHLGTIRVPDPRLDRLQEIYDPKKVTHAELTCVDVPGNHGSSVKGIDAKTLEQIRDVDTLALVVAAFDESHDPANDVESFMLELLITDQILVEKRIGKCRKQADKKKELEALERLLEHLSEEKLLIDVDIDEADQSLLQHYAFVSDKPIVVAINADDAALDDGRHDEAAAALNAKGIPAFVLAGQLEVELAQLEPEEQEAFLEELGITETARSRFIQAVYKALNLITFLTAGEKEVRAWPIPRGFSAKKAAGRIHSDLERGFIRAEAFHFDEVDATADEAALRAAGKLRVEGKDYVVVDGDVLLIRHSG